MHPSVERFEKWTRSPTFREELKKLLSKSYLHVRTPRSKAVLRVQAVALEAIREYLNSMGFVELLPPIIGPVTDPGIRGARQASIDFYGHSYKVMSSAILYKQMMATALGRIYIVSPNVRLEPEKTIYTGRHLVEFVQVDVEEAHATYHRAMDVAEGLFKHVVRRVLERAGEELKLLGRSLEVPRGRFERISYDEALGILEKLGCRVDYGTEIPWRCEVVLSAYFEEPFFIYDYPRGSRGFYDREDPERPGILRDFDMLYPEGFGEAISGAEREYEYEKVVERIKEGGEDPRIYGWYLEMLSDGIAPTAGFGIGVERLTRYLCGLEAVWEARPYPKLPGIVSP